ncbi:MAG: hypothetical protein WCX84_05825 [Syntrophales bacterium]|nr:hypothetical protein [Syntrophales bacterium]
MYRKMVFFTLSFLLVVSLIGCGGLRYNMSTPEAKGFHPKRIGILPVSVGSFAEARGVIDQTILTALVERKWFTRVVSIDTLMRKGQTDRELEDDVSAYLNKLENLNYSDPELSRKIGDFSQVDALLIVSLDYWNYLKDEDTKIAKVGLGIRMVNAETGKLVWEARHIQADRFLVAKPGLPDVAKKLVKTMARHMPR